MSSQSEASNLTAKLTDLVTKVTDLATVTVKIVKILANNQNAMLKKHPQATKLKQPKTNSKTSHLLFYHNTLPLQRYFVFFQAI